MWNPRAPDRVFGSLMAGRFAVGACPVISVSKAVVLHTNPARNPYRFRRNLTVIAFTLALIVMAMLSAALCLFALKGGH